MRKLQGVLWAALLSMAFAVEVSAVCPTGPPTLISPAHNSTIPFGLNIVLDWNAVANATGYDVYIGLDFDPVSLHSSTTLTQKSIAVEPGRRVEWKVVATAPSCAPQASSHFVFETTCPANPPVLRKPDPGSQFPVGSGITFTWQAVAGAAGYDVKVTPDFGATWDVLAENLTALTYTTDDLEEGDWGWMVRANFDGDCDPLYSQPSSFLVTSCPNSPAPTLVSPAAGAADVSNPVTFQWNRVEGATGYRLLVSVDGALPTSTSTTATSLTQTLQGQSVLWRVQALFPNDCPGTLSADSRFTLRETGCPANPGKATLISPAGGATNLASPVTFQWGAVAGATGYRIVGVWDDTDIVHFTGTQTTATLELSAGQGTWAVQTLFGEDCPSTLSDRRSLQVSQGAPCNNAAPQLIAPPSAGSVDSPLTFQWAPVARAVGYTLFVSTRTSGDDFVPYGNTGAGTTQLERIVPEGATLRWYVAAHFLGCPDTKSEVRSFGIASACTGLSGITLVSPANGAEVTSPVTLQWGALQPGGEYRVSIETESGAPLLFKRTLASSEIFRLPAGKFFWRVEATSDCPRTSERRSFTVKEGTTCANNTAPTLLSPVGTEAQPASAQSPVTLRWNPVPNAIAYRILVAREGQPFEESTFTTATQKELELESGRYRWLVSAIFEGCNPIDSAVAHFVIAREGCVTAIPTVLSPGADQVVTSPVTFLWTAVPGAKKYRVIAILGDEPVVIGATTETTLSRLLPPGDYAVTIESELEECPSTRSPVRRFTVARSQNCTTEAVTLVSPPNGTQNSAQEVDFVWNPVSGAIRYALMARLGDGAETTLGTTEESHLTREVPAGRIKWRVVAFFQGCDPTRSGEFLLEVVRPASCTDIRPKLLFPRNGDEVPSPVAFEVIGVPKATGYRIWVQEGDEPPSIAALDLFEKVDLAPGAYRWFAEALIPNCPSTFSARSEFITVEALPCTTPRKPEALVIGQVLSNARYRVRWTPLPNVSRFEVQESTSSDFSNPTTFVVTGLSLELHHAVSGAPVQYLYRVRGLSDCQDQPGSFSDVVGVYVVEPKTTNGSTELGEPSSVQQTIFLAGGSAARTFAATTDKPWLTVTPANGTLPVAGLTLTVTADPSDLGIGTNTGTVLVGYSGGSAGGVTSNDATSSTIPMSVSLVTPVTPSGKGTPPPDALIFAAVGHAAGVNGSFFETDIRLTNLTAQTQTYDLNFTPSGVDGTETGSSSTIEIAPSETLALDDIVATLFGSGTVGSSLGMLEVRPVTTSAGAPGGLFGSIVPAGIRPLDTAASSRTYNFTPGGTFGQYIPATRFSDFVGRDSVLSMQQIAQSSKFRANFGFLEGSGNSAELLVRVYDTANTLLTTIPVSLAAMQHRQINGMLQSAGINDLTDGRVEVEVVGGDGKVTAYVSEVDNATNDPLLVSPVVKGAIRADRYVVPGAAYINTGSAFWVTDLRIFNAGTTATPATLTFVPQGNPGATLTREVSIEPGEIEVVNNIIGEMFAQPNGVGGAILITTPAETALTATARTYNQTAVGTFGQYIAGVTVAESIGADDRALQILQVEQSTRIRTNIGVSETSGNGATVEISLITPDSLVTQVVTVGLAPNEFRQIGLVSFNPDAAVYNGRVTVKVIEGNGRVTAYGSAIDQITQDPTYVPAL